MLDEARRTADLYRQRRDVAALCTDFNAHAGQPLYLAEVAALLERQGLWAHVAASASGGAIQQASAQASEVMQAVDDATHDVGAGDIEQHFGSDPQGLYSERYLAELYNLGKLGAVRDIADVGHRAIIGRGLAAAESDRLIPGSVIATLDSTRAAAQATVNAAGQPSDDPLIAVTAGRMEDPTKQAKQNLEKAEGRLAELEQLLARDIKDYQPILDDPMAFIRSFRSSPMYKEAQQNVIAARLALGRQLEQHEDDIAAHMQDANAPLAAQKSHDLLFQSYEAIANSDTPTIAFDWVSRHRTDAAFHNAADQALLDGIEQQAEAMDASIKVRTLQAIMTPEKLASGEVKNWYVENISKPYQNAKKIIVAVKDLPEKLDAAELAAKRFVDRHSGDIERKLASEALEKLGAELFAEGRETEVTLAKRILVAFGAGMSSMTVGGQLGAKGIFAQGADVLTFHDDAAELYELIKSGEIGGEAGKNVGKVLEKLKGGARLLNGAFAAVGLIGNVSDINEDLKQLDEWGDDPALKIKIAGEVISSISCICMVIPGLEPVGVALGIIGDAVTVIAGFFVGHPKEDYERAQNAEALRPDDPKLDPFPNDTQHNIAKALASPNAAGNLAVAQQLGLAPGDLENLAMLHPWLFEGEAFIATAEAVRRYFCDPDNEQYGRLKSPYRDSLLQFLVPCNDTMHSLLNAYAALYAGDFKLYWHRGDAVFRGPEVESALPAGAFARG